MLAIEAPGPCVKAHASLFAGTFVHPVSLIPVVVDETAVGKSLDDAFVPVNSYIWLSDPVKKACSVSLGLAYEMASEGVVESVAGVSVVMADATHC